MKQLTLRGLPPEVEKKVEEEANRKGVSYNKAIISLLKKATDSGREGGKAVFHDLDHLCGAWSEDEGAEFDEHLLMQRKIDEGLWK